MLHPSHVLPRGAGGTPASGASRFCTMVPGPGVRRQALTRGGTGGRRRDAVAEAKL